MVCGVGINDLKPAKRTTYNKRVYSLWRGVLRRCYSEKFHDVSPTYKNCKVCERWLTLSNFAEDIKALPGYEMWRDNPNQRISLDKDIRGNGKELYSPETCQFVTMIENTLEALIRHNKIMPVIAVDDNGNIAYKFSSAEEGGKYGFTPQKISEACRYIYHIEKNMKKGHNYYKGYYWFYAPKGEKENEYSNVYPEYSPSLRAERQGLIVIQIKES